MLLANFDRKEHLQHRAVSLRQHGFLVVYVNDINKAVPDEQIKLFADDTNLFISGCTIGEVNFCANKKLNPLYDLLAARPNKLSVCLLYTSPSPRD